MIRVLILFLLFIGCARHVRIYSKGCNIPAIWTDHPEGRRDFRFEHKIYGATFGQTRINLAEVLKNNKFRCEEVKTISIETRQSALDVLTGMIPFLSKTTLVVEGTFKRTKKEAIIIDPYERQREEFEQEFRTLQERLEK